MKYLFILFLGTLTLNSFSQNKTYDQLRIERIQLTNEITRLQAKLKAVNTEMEKLKNGTANVVFEGSGNNRIETKTGSGGAVLRDNSSSTANIITTIKAGEPIILYKEKHGSYIKAAYNGKFGWVSYTSISSNPELNSFMKGKKPVKKTASTTTINTVDINSPRYKRIAKLYGHDKAVKIINKQLWKGMSHGMVVESLGQPTNRTSVNSSEGLKEEWTYSNRTIKFLNGELKSW